MLLRVTLPAENTVDGIRYPCRSFGFDDENKMTTSKVQENLSDVWCPKRRMQKRKIQFSVLGDPLNPRTRETEYSNLP